MISWRMKKMYNVIVRRIKANKNSFDNLLMEVGNNSSNLPAFVIDADFHEATEGIETEIYHFRDIENAKLQFEDEKRRCFTIRGTFHYTFTEVKLTEVTFERMAVTSYNEIEYINSIERELDEKGYFK